jgi:hypothetical protein
MNKQPKKQAVQKKEDINDIFPVDAPFDRVAFRKMLKRARHISIFDIDELEKQYNR